MKIEEIVYDTAREVFDVTGKINIATIFLFCYQKGAVEFAELLYCEDKEAFIKSLNEQYKEYEIDFSINLQDRNIKSAFHKTIEKVKQVFDKDGFHKAVFKKDDMALAVVDLTQHPIFNKKDLKIEDFKKQFNQ
jgi:hypothetical protein